MLLTGQPVHMYDLDKLPAKELIVKDNFERAVSMHAFTCCSTIFLLYYKLNVCWHPALERKPDGNGRSAFQNGTFYVEKESHSERKMEK